jgi:hypothetical protein
VFDANGDEVPWDGVVAALTEERDAAIRERDAAKARVAELEAASGGGLKPHAWGVVLELRDAARAFRDSSIHVHQVRLDKSLAAAEKLLTDPQPAVPASGGGEREAEFDAARHLYDTGHRISPFMTLDSHPKQVSLSIKFRSLVEGQAFHGAMVRFFKTPPQPRGWLTSEERESIDRATRTVEMFDGFDRTLTKSLRNLLARSTPPEVVKPAFFDTHDAFRNVTVERRDAEWIAAITTVGVAVKEVGR